jgi:chromosome segregation ATPase
MLGMAKEHKTKQIAVLKEQLKQLEHKVRVHQEEIKERNKYLRIKEDELKKTSRELAESREKIRMLEAQLNKERLHAQELVLKLGELEKKLENSESFWGKISGFLRKISPD